MPRIQQEEILLLDTLFDFNTAYLREGRLYNFSIISQEKVSVTVVIDGKEEVFSRQGFFFSVYSKEWREKKIFLEDPSFPSLPIFHSSHERAQNWLDSIIVTSGYRGISRELALRYAADIFESKGDFLIR